jgi:hypothetical protein
MVPEGERAAYQRVHPPEIFFVIANSSTVWTMALVSRTG